MLQKSLKLFIAVALIVSHVALVCGNGYAAAPTVRLIINPNKTDVYAGSDPIALTAKASGTGLQYNWELQGPGKIDGTGSAVFYNIPATIQGSSAQAILTVVVTDETGQETTETVTFNILSSKAPATQPAEPKAKPKKGMSTGTKIAIGVGAAALVGGGLALALSGGEDEGIPFKTGFWTLNYDWGCDGYSVGTASWELKADNTFIGYDYYGSPQYYGTWSLDGNQFRLVYSSGTTYTGTVDPSGTSMNGTMVSYTGSTGCWNASFRSTKVMLGSQSLVGSCQDSSEAKKCE